MTTFASLFSGFGGADIGAMQAGLTPVSGVEYVPEIAEVANANLGGHVRVADVLDLSPATFDRVDVLHASPPCPNFSVAKSGRKETTHDLAMAGKVAEFVTVLRPNVFTLENVWGYRNSRSWAIIRDALYGAGYWLNVEHVNAADFGVPQTRKRMIVRAVLGGWVPYLPEPMSWMGWYAAIEDMIPTLPESKLAPWQLARLPDDLRESVLWAHGPIADDEPPVMRQPDKPSMTLRTTSGPYNAVLINGDNGSRDLSIVNANSPSFTQRNGAKTTSRAILNTRVVAMTPRCLARFQSFPDWYELPEKKTLAAKGIGNAVPPLLYQRIAENMVQA